MELLEAMARRHSVRAYTGVPLSAAHQAELRACMEQCNRDGEMHIQLAAGEPQAFSSALARLMGFSGVQDYMVLAGPEGAALGEKCGYYGEKLVLRAQQLGLNTCWAGMSYARVPGAAEIRPGERLALVIAVGYGKDQGRAHHSKARECVMRTYGRVPEWFIRGVDAALLAPTARNRQKFWFTLEGEALVRAEAGKGLLGRVDLGIVKYHFELGAGVNHFRWAE